MMDTEIGKETADGAGNEGSSLKKGRVAFNTRTLETCMVGGVKNGCVAVAVRLSPDGRLLRDDVVMYEKDCREARQEEKLALQRAMNRHHLMWHVHRGDVRENLYRPRKGQMVKISLLGEQVILGVFREFDSDGRIVMYCMAEENARPRYSMHEVAGRAEDFQITPIPTSDRNSFNRSLEKEGLEWDGRQLRLIPRDERPPRGGSYYYLDEVFEIRNVRDAYKPKDRKRFDAGNYFTSLDDITQVRECILSIMRMKSGRSLRGDLCARGRKNAGKL